MKNLIDKWKKTSPSKKACWVMAIILILLGSICICFPKKIVSILPYLFGGFVLVAGIVAIVHGFRIKEYEDVETNITSRGMIAFVIGMVILMHHSDALILIGAIWGIKGLSASVKNLNLMIYHLHKKERIRIELIELIIEFPLAMLLLLDPIGNLPHHILILGLEQVGTGIQLVLNKSEERLKD